MLWPPAETRPTFGRYKPAGQNPLISGRLELVGLKKVETHVSEPLTVEKHEGDTMSESNNASQMFEEAKKKMRALYGENKRITDGNYTHLPRKGWKLSAAGNV